MITRRERLLRLGKALLARLFVSLQRFPETLLFCAATVLVLMLLVHVKAGPVTEFEKTLGRLAAVLALGIPLTLSIRVFFERAGFLKMPLKILICAAAAAGLALYYFYLLQDFSMVSLSRYVAVSLALYLAFTFIPYFYRRPNYELYVIRLCISFLVTYLFAAILFGGLAAILATINYLFSAGISEKVYIDIWLIVAGIFAPAFFLADIPEGDREVEPESYPRVISVLLSYIVVPLILAYCAILYVYFVKIVATRQWPEVMVSHLVLWYAIISTLVIFSLHPLRRDNRWINAFITHFPKLILPLLGLMFAAMGVRVAAYGITENRYFVLAAGLWVAGSMLYLILARKPRKVFLPASLALAAILAVFGPWSSHAVSVHSQNRRFEKIAAEYNLLQEGKIVRPAAALPESVQREISSIILYFDRRHGLERLRALPDGFATDQMEDLFGFPLYPDYGHPDTDEVHFYYVLSEEDSFWDLSGFDYFMQFSSAGQRYRADELEAAYAPENHELKIRRRGEEIYVQNVAEIAIKLHRANVNKGDGRELLAKDVLTYLDRGENLKVLYGFTHYGGQENLATGEVNIHYLEFYLFVGLEPEEAQ